jgi:hypothetical protein
MLVRPARRRSELRWRRRRRKMRRKMMRRRRSVKTDDEAAIWPLEDEKPESDDSVAQGKRA